MTKSTEFLHIRTIGSDRCQQSICELVDVGVLTDNGEFNALIIPYICNPQTSQPITFSRNTYNHINELDLADSADVGVTLEVDVLLGSDTYWNLVTG
jgi:hypothetical protein